MPHFYADYPWIEARLSAHAPALRALGITAVVGVARGGLVPAFMAANLLDLASVRVMDYDRASRTPALHGAPFTPDDVVLLCDDVAGRSELLPDCMSYLAAQAARVHTLVIAHFAGSRIVPDFGHDSGETIVVLPWERHILNPAERADYAAGRRAPADSAYYRHGVDLDGIFLADIPDSHYEADLAAALAARRASAAYDVSLLPPRHERGWLVVTARPHMDRADTEAWLIERGFDVEAVLLRDTSAFDFPLGADGRTKSVVSAQSKCAHIRAQGITHFYESDAEQALLIAQRLPMVRVCWWNNALGVRTWVNAAPIVAMADTDAAQPGDLARADLAKTHLAQTG
jgi:hypoxanthine phosphoribosyltransferase